MLPPLSQSARAITMAGASLLPSWKTGNSYCLESCLPCMEPVVMEAIASGPVARRAALLAVGFALG